MLPGTLARFAEGLDWDSIYSLDPKTGSVKWLRAIVEAEDAGVLTWDRSRKVWTLTEAGRERVRDVA